MVSLFNFRLKLLVPKTVLNNHQSFLERDGCYQTVYLDGSEKAAFTFTVHEKMETKTASRFIEVVDRVQNMYSSAAEKVSQKTGADAKYSL